MFLCVGVLIIPSEGKGDFGAKVWVVADVIGGDLAVITECWEVAHESMNKGLFTQNGCRVVAEEK